MREEGKAAIGTLEILRGRVFGNGKDGIERGDRIGAWEAARIREEGDEDALRRESEMKREESKGKELTKYELDRLTFSLCSAVCVSKVKG